MAKAKLRELFPHFVVSAPLTVEEKDQVEKEVFGKALPSKHRNVNDSILNSHDIISSYLEDDYVSMAGRGEQNKLELDSDLNSLERSVEKARQEILAGMTPAGRAQAIEMGLV